jgi:DNA-binding response OmpR family regulator
LGANDVLAKPFEVDELLSCLIRLGLPPTANAALGAGLQEDAQ